MPLIDPSKMPPGGYFYREVAVNWQTPNAYLPINMIAQQLQRVRMQNPNAGLDPSYEACLKSVDDYTCARLHNSPAWCVQEQSPIAQTQERNKRERKKCGSCGKKKNR